MEKKKKVVEENKEEKKVVEEKKEDWTIFGSTDDNPDPTQVQALVDSLRSSLEVLRKSDITELVSFRKPPQIALDL